MGKWRIRNQNYYPITPSGNRLAKYPKERPYQPPWVAVYESANPYDQRESRRFFRFSIALGYALSGGTPIKKNNTEER